tara:strand:+ start:2449 stop:2775 length:327 start_codon:yes stop_codon:yes gene_type:complete
MNDKSTEFEYILISLQKNSNILINDLNNLNKSITEIELYKNNNIDISVIYDNIKEHISDLNKCLNEFNSNIKLINDKLKLNTIKLNSKTNTLITKKNDKNETCCCFFI